MHQYQYLPLRAVEHDGQARGSPTGLKGRDQGEGDGEGEGGVVGSSG